MRLIPLLALAVGCSDYDLTRPDEVPEEKDPVDSEEPEPEPSEDPDISVFPETLDFGYVAKDCESQPEQVTITNEGKAQLNVASIELAGAAKSKFELHMGGDTSVPPLQLGESYTFELTFTPSAWVEYTIDVEVASNDPDEPLVGVPTLGEGAEDALYEESFEQTYQDKVDVLLVVDNSCSMEESVNKLRTDFDNFMTVFDSLNLDYHLGVVSTDMDNPSEKGKLLGTPNFIDDSYSTADALDWMRETANLGSNGSGDEKGLEASQTALSEPLKSGANKGFLRADSAVAVLVISDENDSSSVSSSSYESWFIGLRTDPAFTSFSGIVGDRGLGCFDAFAISATGGDKYIDVIDATGGVFQSLCSADFATAATNMAQAAAGMTVVFPLAKTPSDSGRIAVLVDGVAVDNDPFTGFSYETDTNSIRFHDTAVPGPGAFVEVSYPVDGGC